MNCNFQKANCNFNEQMDVYITNNKDTIFNELNYRIKEAEVQRAISGLKSGKAAVKDLILNEMIKSSALLPILT